MATKHHLPGTDRQSYQRAGEDSGVISSQIFPSVLIGFFPLTGSQRQMNANAAPCPQDVETGNSACICHTHVTNWPFHQLWVFFTLKAERRGPDGLKADVLKARNAHFSTQKSAWRETVRPTLNVRPIWSNFWILKMFFLVPHRVSAQTTFFPAAPWDRAALPLYPSTPPRQKV